MEIRGKKVKMIKSDDENDCGLKCCFYNGKDCLDSEEKLICCDEMGVEHHFVEVEEEAKSVLKNSHYTGGKADVIDLALMSGDAEGFFATSAMKYIQRRKLKGSEIDDVVKAFDYIAMLLLDIHDIDSEVLKTIIEKRKMRNTK